MPQFTAPPGLTLPPGYTLPPSVSIPPTISSQANHALNLNDSFNALIASLSTIVGVLILLAHCLTCQYCCLSAAAPRQKTRPLSPMSSKRLQARPEIKAS